MVLTPQRATAGWTACGRVGVGRFGDSAHRRGRRFARAHGAPRRSAARRAVDRFAARLRDSARRDTADSCRPMRAPAVAGMPRARAAAAAAVRAAARARVGHDGGARHELERNGPHGDRCSRSSFSCTTRCARCSAWRASIGLPDHRAAARRGARAPGAAAIIGFVLGLAADSLDAERVRRRRARDDASSDSARRGSRRCSSPTTSLLNGFFLFLGKWAFDDRA